MMVLLKKQNRSQSFLIEIIVLSFFFIMYCITAEATNLVDNPGFESGIDGKLSNWITVFRKSENMVQWIPEKVHSGGRAIKIVATVAEDPGKSVGVYSDFISVPENVCIELSTWIKIDNIVNKGGYYKGRVVLYCYDVNKKKILHSDIQMDGSISDWTKIKNNKITPLGTKFIKIGFLLTSCTGAMMVDDVDLSIIQQAPTVPLSERNYPVIIPSPWKALFGKNCFPIGSLAIVIDKALGKQSYLKEEMKEFFLKVGISNFKFFVSGDTQIKQFTTQLLIGDFEHTIPLINQFKTKFPGDQNQDLGNQGYFLSVAEGPFQKVIYLGAKSEQGRFYGFQTLKQVLNKISEPKIYVLDILDDPTLERRGIAMGVQWFSKQKDAINRLSKLKGNFVVNHGSFLNNKFLNKWREDFTPKELLIMERYLSLCKEHFVIPRLNFGPRSYKPTVNPVKFSSDKEISIIVEKIKRLYAIGFRYFGLNFDDLQNVGQEILLVDADKNKFRNDIGKAHSYFTKSVYNQISESCPDINFSITPMNYGDNQCITDEQQKYLSAFASLPAQIELIVCTTTNESTLKFNKLTNKTITIWSNFLTQFESSFYFKKYTWPFQDRINWKAPGIKRLIDGFIFLPIVPGYEDVSKVSWKTASDCMWSPERYLSLKSFQKAMTQYTSVKNIE